jgi:hypothetical protein
MFNSSGKKIVVAADLHDRAVQAAERLGYASIREFVEHLLEKELRVLSEQDSKQKLLDKMKGLGYLQ